MLPVVMELVGYTASTVTFATVNDPTRNELGWPLFYGFLVAYQLLAIAALIYIGVRTGNLAKAEEYQVCCYLFLFLIISSEFYLEWDYTWSSSSRLG